MRIPKPAILVFAMLILVSASLFGQDSARKMIRTIIIDPGHGGLDPGARGTFSSEADVSLSVSLKLGDAIAKEFPDIKLVYTRTTDVLPGNKNNKDEALKYRATLANQSGGDLFIAIHCNSAGKHAGGWNARRVIGKTLKTKTVKKGGKWVKKKYYEYEYETYWMENLAHGTETYVWAVGKNNAKVNSVAMNTEYSGEIDSTSMITLPDPKDPTEKVRMLLYTQIFFRKSLSLADFVEKEFEAAGRVSRGVKQRNDKGIWVLQATGMPSVLIEIGFISNTEEEKYINSDDGQSQIVNNILTALRNYKNKLEYRSGAVDETGEKKAF
ncbi:MAG TPA: N-acetylmuramoyl-L-alanine amidase [Chitinophagaceae bacterium]|nr:N-acetylmuramoyl-L-alanine amidase [Chitinophagaceae bacterium]